MIRANRFARIVLRIVFAIQLDHLHGQSMENMSQRASAKVWICLMFTMLQQKEQCPFSTQESARQTKPKKGQSEKFMNVAHFCEFWCFSSGKQTRFTSNFCSGLPPGKVHELAFFGSGLPGWLLILGLRAFISIGSLLQLVSVSSPCRRRFWHSWGETQSHSCLMATGEECQNVKIGWPKGPITHNQQSKSAKTSVKRAKRSKTGENRRKNAETIGVPSVALVWQSRSGHFWGGHTVRSLWTSYTSECYGIDQSLPEDSKIHMLSQEL